MSLRSWIEDALKRASVFVVPSDLLYRLWHRRRKGLPRTEDGTTEQLRGIVVQAGIRLDVYWTEVEQGAGPCASLFVLDEEVLVHVDVGDALIAKLTPGAVSSLALSPGASVTAIVKANGIRRIG